MAGVVLWTVIVIWVPSCLLTLSILWLDERSHRRQSAEIVPAPPRSHRRPARPERPDSRRADPVPRHLATPVA